MEEEWSEARLRLSELRDVGDTVVGVGDFQAKGRASGIEIDVPVGFVVRFELGTAVYGRFYSDPKDALEAAGLSE